jgi:hypothetical protein
VERPGKAICNNLRCVVTDRADYALLACGAEFDGLSETPSEPDRAVPKRQETGMLNKSLVIAVLGATAAAGTLSTNASAQGDPVLGGLIGAGIGAAIGHSINGSNGAWVGGTLGAVTGATIAANSGGYYYGPSPAYGTPAPAYYAPATRYYAPAPVYYAPPTVVYRPRPAAYIAPYYGPRYVAPRWGYGNARYPAHGRPAPYAYGQGDHGYGYGPSH